MLVWSFEHKRIYTDQLYHILTEFCGGWQRCIRSVLSSDARDDINRSSRRGITRSPAGAADRPLSYLYLLWPLPARATISHCCRCYCSCGLLLRWWLQSDRRRWGNQAASDRRPMWTCLLDDAH